MWHLYLKVKLSAIATPTHLLCSPGRASKRDNRKQPPRRRIGHLLPNTLSQSDIKCTRDKLDLVKISMDLLDRLKVRHVQCEHMNRCSNLVNLSDYVIAESSSKWSRNIYRNSWRDSWCDGLMKCLWWMQEWPRVVHVAPSILLTGAITATVVCPLDVLKTRLQVQSRAALLNQGIGGM